MEQQLAFKSLFGKLPYEKEKELAKEIIDDVEEIYARVFIPFIVADKEIVADRLRSIKKKLDVLI
jgi:hypothetical protein